MKWASIFQRGTVRCIHSLILGAVGFGLGTLAFAQGPSNLPSINYTRSMSFDLPVVIDTDTRANLSEICLYMKTPTTNWQLQEKGSNFLTRFSCRVQQDGEYWYSLVMVDRKGGRTPPDVNQAGPLQRVVVDTAAPVIQVAPVRSPDGSEYCLNCTIQDANPDPNMLRAVCKTNVGDIPLELLPGYPGVFRLKGDAPMQFPVLISAVDLAKNIGTREVNVRDMIQTALGGGQGQQRPPVQPVGLVADPNMGPNPYSPTHSQQAYNNTNAPPGPRLDSGYPQNPQPYRVQSAPPTPIEPQQGAYQPPYQPYDDRQNGGYAQEPRNARVDGPYQLINTPQASMDYRIDQVGPSGVGRVEVFMTPDQGQSWHRLGEDLDRRSPADIKLPGDGVFGIRLAISNGNGFGGRPPVRGDAPHCTIEVDTTAPFVQLRVPELVANGQVEIRWNATDKNFGPAPIHLYFRTRPEGSWQPVARNLKNDGVFRWSFPREISSQFYFKIEAWDLAGNASSDVTRQPVVIDTSEPRPTVLGVSGASGPARLFGGN